MDASRRSDLSFVIPVRDDAARLDVCLQSIARSVPAGRAVEIVVADNGSTDASAAVARMYGATVLDLPGLRLGELRNRAAEAAGGTVLAFVDADHEIAPDWIAAALDALADERVGAAGAPCDAPCPGTWVQRSYDRLRRHPDRQEPVEWLGSGNLAVARASFEQVGGFDTTLETCEDVDLCRKLRAHGYRLVSDPRLRNVHHGDPRTLTQVFLGELWRGRDNVRVSLRAPRTGRTLVSAAVPVFNLTASVAVVAGLLSAPVVGPVVAVTAGSGLALMVALRASRMLRASAPGDWPNAFAVAAAYESGRALAVAGRFGYTRRRRSLPGGASVRAA